MNIKNNTFSLDLPLSWIRSDIQQIKKTNQRLLINGVSWISLAEIPELVRLDGLISKLKQQLPDGLIIRGCNLEITEHLIENGFKALAIGQEGLIDLDKNIFNKKSLKALVRRGAKQGRFKKFELNSKNIKKLNHLRTKTRHYNKPQLTNLFLSRISKNTDVFVWENLTGWDAALSLSKTNRIKVHTELLLRSKDAKPGIMEALIQATSEYLKNEGFKTWSLGETPFLFPKNYNLTNREKFISNIGKNFPFIYDSNNLFHFKNKFTTSWQPIYICGFPNISFLSLIQMSYFSKYLHLALYQLWNRFKQIFKEVNEAQLDLK